MLCTLIFIKLNVFLWSTVKPLYLCDVLSQIGQGQSKISAIIRSIQCNNKKNSVKILTVDEDQKRGRLYQTTEYTAYVSATDSLEMVPYNTTLKVDNSFVVP